MSEHIDKIKDAIVGGLHKDIEALVQAAVESGIAPELIVNEAMIPGMDVVGQKFSTNEIFVPEMLVAAVTTPSSENAGSRLAIFSELSLSFIGHPPSQELVTDIIPAGKFFHACSPKGHHTSSNIITAQKIKTG